MPKLKTNRGAAKRFQRTATGRYKRAQSHHNHILTKKSTKRKRHMRRDAYVSPTEVDGVRQLMPYS